jgi:hypothetical protein
MTVSRASALSRPPHWNSTSLTYLALVSAWSLPDYSSHCASDNTAISHQQPLASHWNL